MRIRPYVRVPAGTGKDSSTHLRVVPARSTGGDRPAGRPAPRCGSQAGLHCVGSGDQTTASARQATAVELVPA